VPPGLKLELLGPVECRRGLLLLTPASVRVLGGAVEEIAHQFAADRVLADRIAGRPGQGIYEITFASISKRGYKFRGFFKTVLFGDMRI
jgi:hypothetical protein